MAPTEKTPTPGLAERVISLLVAALVGILAGAFAGIVIVDYTDAYASHTAIDLAVVALCSAAGLAAALLLRDG